VALAGGPEIDWPILAGLAVGQLGIVVRGIDNHVVGASRLAVTARDTELHTLKNLLHSQPFHANFLGSEPGESPSCSWQSAVGTLKCVDGITVPEKEREHYMDRTVGIVTALNPVLGMRSRRSWRNELTRPVKAFSKSFARGTFLRKSRLKTCWIRPR
jgi:hypothetical protein